MDNILVFYITQYCKEHPGRRIELVDIPVSIDPGKVFSQATLVVIFCWKEDNELNEKVVCFSLAGARCRKDNTEVIVNMCGPRLNEGMKRI